MPELCVASFNIFWGTAARTRARFDVVAACASLDADVLVLQECWREDGTAGQAAEVGAALGYEVVESPVMNRSTGFPRPRSAPWHRTEGTEGDWYMAVLSRLPVLARRTVALHQLRFDPSRRHIVSIDVDVDGTRLPIAGTHLPHLEMGVPLHTRELRAALPPADQPAVLAGDMNMWSWCIAAMTPKGWRRAVKGRTWPARLPHSQIDHIMVTEPVAVLHGEVVALVASDHRPVRARLAL